MIFWIFPVVLCHAFCMWRWPICKDLDLIRRSIWSHHHLHLVDDQLIQPINSLLATPRWRDPTRSTVTNFGFQFRLYHALVPFSFLRTIILASLFSSHTGAHQVAWHQYGVSIQISRNGGKTISADLAFTFFLFPESGLYLLSGFGFYFDLFWMAWRWKPAIQ